MKWLFPGQSHEHGRVHAWACRAESAHKPVVGCMLLRTRDLTCVVLWLVFADGPSSSHPGIIEGSTAITKLYMQDCLTMGDPEGLDAVAHLANLQDLDFCNICIDKDLWDGGAPATLSTAAIQSLQHLTSLDVSYVIPEPLRDDVSTLTQLRPLSLSFTEDANIRLTNTRTPGFSLPPGLVDISLSQTATG